jgi:hypothetical protein
MTCTCNAGRVSLVSLLTSSVHSAPARPASREKTANDRIEHVSMQSVTPVNLTIADDLFDRRLSPRPASERIIRGLIMCFKGHNVSPWPRTLRVGRTEPSSCAESQAPERRRIAGGSHSKRGLITWILTSYFRGGCSSISWSDRTAQNKAERFSSQAF